MFGAGLLLSCRKTPEINNTLPPPPAQPPSPPPANPPAPPITDLHLTYFDTISTARYNMVAGAAGSKVLFVGGFYDVPFCFYDSSDDSPGWLTCRYESNRADIYDTITHSWTAHDLARYYYGAMTAVTADNKVFFSNGTDTAGRTWSGKVDVYDALINSWSVIQLSEPRTGTGTGSVGNKVFFAGGSIYSPGYRTSNRVDIYDVSGNTWATAALSEARTSPMVTTAGNKIIFAGGWNEHGASDVVDIFDASSNTWSVARLSHTGGFMTAFSIADEAFFMVGAPGNRIPPPRKIDVYNSNSNNWSVREIDFFAEGYPSVVLNNRAFVFVGRTVFTYDKATGSWSKGMIDLDFGYPAIIAVGNAIYFAGGSGGGDSQTNKVWRVTP